MKLKYLTHCALFLAACYISTNAFAQWVWLDEHGAKQFSDGPPPAGTPPNHILKQPHAPAPNYSSDKAEDKPADTGSNANGSTAKAPPTQADKEADFKKRRDEQAAKDKKAAEDAQKAQATADNCARAKQYYSGLQSGARIPTTDANGQRGYLNDDDRAKEEARTQGVLDSCNK